MTEIGIGIIGGGYMGKAHAVAMSAVGSIFNTKLRPRLEMVAATSEKSAEKYRAAYGFARGTGDWRVLVDDPRVEAIVIASPPDTHVEIVERAAKLGKAVMCEKPLGSSTTDSARMMEAAANIPNMVGFNYIRTPASQYVHQLLQAGEIGQITWFRAEHHEDYYGDPKTPASWRTKGITNGALGDLAHVFNLALRMMGPIDRLSAEIETVHKTRPSPQGDSAVENDDQGQFICRFENGVMGHIGFSRIATGRKMGYAYEIHGTKGSIRFDQEDQNTIWLYKTGEAADQSGFKKIYTGPAHPDFKPFCLGAGHGTGYQDQIIIEARDFLRAIETGQTIWPSFADGHEVNRVIAAVLASNTTKTWVNLSNY